MNYDKDFLRMSNWRGLFNLTSANVTEKHGDTAAFVLIMHTLMGGLPYSHALKEMKMIAIGQKISSF